MQPGFAGGEVSAFCLSVYTCSGLPRYRYAAAGCLLLASVRAKRGQLEPLSYDLGKSASYACTY